MRKDVRVVIGKAAKVAVIGGVIAKIGHKIVERMVEKAVDAALESDDYDDDDGGCGDCDAYGCEACDSCDDCGNRDDCCNNHCGACCDECCGGCYADDYADSYQAGYAAAQADNNAVALAALDKLSGVTHKMVDLFRDSNADLMYLHSEVLDELLDRQADDDSRFGLYEDDFDEADFDEENYDDYDDCVDGAGDADEDEARAREDYQHGVKAFVEEDIDD